MRSKVKIITYIAIFASMLAVISPLTINISIVPFSFATLMIYIIGAISKKSEGLISILIYIFLGIIGLPVFSGYTGGIGVLLGVTGGFIIGYIPCSILVNMIVRINKKNIFLYFLSMILGTMFCYLCGCFWYMYLTDSSFVETLIICVVPFIIFDLIKIIFASFISYLLNNKFLNESKNIIKNV